MPSDAKNDLRKNNNVTCQMMKRSHGLFCTRYTAKNIHLPKKIEFRTISG